MKTRVQDLPKEPTHGQCLRCRTCGETFSAHRGDYFLSRPDRVFTHCGKPMQLGTVRSIFEVTA